MSGLLSWFASVLWSATFLALVLGAIAVLYKFGPRLLHAPLERLMALQGISVRGTNDLLISELARSVVLVLCCFAGFVAAAHYAAGFLVALMAPVSGRFMYPWELLGPLRLILRLPAIAGCVYFIVRSVKAGTELSRHKSPDGPAPMAEQAVTCPNCGIENEPSANVCGACGERLVRQPTAPPGEATAPSTTPAAPSSPTQVVRCPSCGSAFEAVASGFCDSCGGFVDVPVEAPPTAPASTIQEEATPAPVAQPEPITQPESPATPRPTGAQTTAPVEPPPPEQAPTPPPPVVAPEPPSATAPTAPAVAAPQPEQDAAPPALVEKEPEVDERGLVICKRCGAKNSLIMAVCGMCGTVLKEEPPVASEPQPSRPEARRPAGPAKERQARGRECPACARMNEPAASECAACGWPFQ